MICSNRCGYDRKVYIHIFRGKYLRANSLHRWELKRFKEGCGNVADERVQFRKEQVTFSLQPVFRTF